MKLVIAGNTRQFRDWLKEKAKHPREDYVSASDYYDLFGRDYECAMKIGTWWENKFINQIEDFIRSRKIPYVEAS